MSRLLSLASGTLPEFSPVEVVHAAAQAGFGGCGIWFDSDAWRDKTTRDVAQAFAQTGLVPLEIEVVAVKPGALDPQHKRQLECGAEIGATECIVVSSDPDLAAFTARFGELCEIAAPLGINLCLEFLPIFEVSDLKTALGVIETVDQSNDKLLLDPLHVARTGLGFAELAAIPEELMSFAQFCDSKSKLSAPRSFDALLSEAIDGRLNPGRGQLPLQVFVDQLDANLPLSLELRSKDLRERFPDAVSRACNVYDDTTAFLKTLEN